eukprot:9422549-Ditylum_brightwellii.AAC.1
MRCHAAVIHISVTHARRQSCIGRTPVATPTSGTLKVSQDTNTARLSTKELGISGRKAGLLDIVSEVVQC